MRQTLIKNMFGHNMITHSEILPVNLEIRGHSLPYGLTEDLAGNRQELYATLSSYKASNPPSWEALPGAPASNPG